MATVPPLVLLPLPCSVATVDATPSANYVFWGHLIKWKENFSHYSLPSQGKQTNQTSERPNDRTSERPNRANQPDQRDQRNQLDGTNDDDGDGDERTDERTKPTKRNWRQSTVKSQQATRGRWKGAWQHTGWVTLLAGDLEQLQLQWQQEEQHQEQQEQRQQ